MAFFIGTPGEIRTPDPLVRSQVLYPAELRAHIFVVNYKSIKYILVKTFKTLNLSVSLYNLMQVNHRKLDQFNQAKHNSFGAYI